MAEIAPVGRAHEEARRRDGGGHRRRRGFQKALHQRSGPGPGRRLEVVLLGRALLPDAAGDRRVGLGDGAMPPFCRFVFSSRGRGRKVERTKNLTGLSFS